MGYRLPNAAKMYGLSDLNILMMDYRGFGETLINTYLPAYLPTYLSCMIFA
jgi:hypothetical protein